MNKLSVTSGLILVAVLLSACQTNTGTVDVEPSFASATPSVTAVLTAIPTATAKPLPTATARVLTLDEQVVAFMNGKIEFPGNLSPEDYSAFIRGMNESRGSKPIWVEGVDGTGAKVVLYYDVARGKMVQLKGSYAENREVIDQNTWDQYIALSSDDEGNLQFVHPDTGKLITVPGSVGMDWSMVIDNTNFDSAPIDWPTGENRFGFAAIYNFEYLIVGRTTVDGIEHKLPNIQTRNNLVPGVVIDNSPFILSFQTNQWLRFDCLEFMFVRTDARGKATYGVRTFIGSSFLMGEEGMLMDLKSPFHVADTADLRSLKPGIYYAAISPNQQVVWDELRHGDIDALQNTTSEKNAYNAAVNDPTPDENIVLTPDFLIKKK